MSDEPINEPVVDIHLTANDEDATIHIYLVSDSEDGPYHIWIGNGDKSAPVATYADDVDFTVAASLLTATMLAFPVGGSDRGVAFLDGTFGSPNKDSQLIVPSTDIVEALNQ